MRFFVIKLTKLKIQILKLKYLEDINQLIKSDTAEENHRNMFLQNKRRQKV